MVHCAVGIGEGDQEEERGTAGGGAWIGCGGRTRRGWKGSHGAGTAAHLNKTGLIDLCFDKSCDRSKVLLGLSYPDSSIGCADIVDENGDGKTKGD